MSITTVQVFVPPSKLSLRGDHVRPTDEAQSMALNAELSRLQALRDPTYHASSSASSRVDDRHRVVRFPPITFPIDTASLQSSVVVSSPAVSHASSSSAPPSAVPPSASRRASAAADSSSSSSSSSGEPRDPQSLVRDASSTPQNAYKVLNGSPIQASIFLPGSLSPPLLSSPLTADTGSLEAAILTSSSSAPAPDSSSLTPPSGTHAAPSSRSASDSPSAKPASLTASVFHDLRSIPRGESNEGVAPARVNSQQSITQRIWNCFLSCCCCCRRR